MSFYETEFNLEFGINNVGNTCYQNSIYQSLMRFEPIQKFLLKTITDKDKIIPLSDHILSKFIRWLIFYMFSAKVGAYYNITKLMKNTFNICFPGDDFTSGSQEDASEILVMLIDVLNEASTNYIKNKICVTRKRYVECHSCGNKKQLIETDKDTVLKINFNESKVMEEMINYDRCAIEKFLCERCNKNVNWICEPLKTYPSDFLIICPKRYVYGHNFIQKTHDEISLKCHLKIDDATYSLISIVLHYGDASGGHYIMNTKMGDRWVTIDDDEVSANDTPTDPEKEFKSGGYIFFYKKLKI